MRRLLIYGLLSFLTSGLAAQTLLTLDEAVRKAIRHKPSLEVLRLQTQQEELSRKEIKARWWPEISLSYDYRYNPIVATTIIPIGQFDVNNPTNAVRGIRMGTKWQQNGGITLSQPLLDFAIQRNLRRSKLLCELASANQKIGHDELIYEVAQSYLNICRKEELMEINRQDTLRTYVTLRQQMSLFKNEKLLLSDLNRARINHNDAISLLEDVQTDLLTEKIYLSFLTGISTDTLVFFTRFDPQQSRRQIRWCLDEKVQPDSLYILRKLNLEQRTAREDLKIAKARSLPTLSLEAFLGGNHFNDCFSPFERNTWYGSSYLGISLKLPIVYQENFKARNKRLHLNATIYALQEAEQRRQLNTNALISFENIRKTEKEIERLEENKSLEQQILVVLSRRFEEHQTAAFELNLEELEYLKIQTRLQEKYTEQILESLNYLKNTGLLYLLQHPAQPEE